MTTATVVASHLVGRDRRTSIFDFATVVNAIVHTLMYAYYWSPSRLRVLKRLLKPGDAAVGMAPLGQVVKVHFDGWFIGGR